MSVYRVAHRYAKAALDLAYEQNQGDRVAEDLEMVRQAMRGSREFASFLKSPVIPKEKKIAVLAELFGKKVCALTTGFLDLLVEKSRESALADIIEEFFRLRDEKLGIVTLEIRAATELTNEQQKEMVKRFEGITRKKIRMTFNIDKELKGGFIARVGDTVYDGSIKRQLELLREQFAEGIGRN